MKRLLENLKDFFERDWTLEEKILIIICSILTGIVYGFLFAPIKKGISIGNITDMCIIRMDVKNGLRMKSSSNRSSLTKQSGIFIISSETMAFSGGGERRFA